MTDGMAAISADGVVTYCNPALACLLGRMPSQLVGRPFVDMLADESGREYRSRQSPGRGGACRPYVLQLRHANGHLVERVNSPSPVFASDGLSGGSIANLTAERVQHLDAEAALARRLIESSGSILYRASADADMRIEFVSDSIAGLGYSPRTLALARASWIDLVHPLDRREVIAGLQDGCANDRCQFRRHYRLLDASGGYRWYDEEAVRWCDPDGRPQWVEGMLRDVTPLYQAREAAHAALAQTVAVVGTVGEKRDPYTGAHQRRVADLAFAIGRRLGLHGDQLDGLYLAALIHDIGKVGVPSELLSRPGRLTREEMALMQTHVQIGVDLISGTVFPWPLARIIAEHHERLDGSGYPHGLRGDQLRQESRILAVSDVFEAMANHRPYWPALGAAAALRELSDYRGRRYCPDSVDACIQIAGSLDGDALWDSLGTERRGGVPSGQLALELWTAAA